jgi:hypothetical protein
MAAFPNRIHCQSRENYGYHSTTKKALPKQRFEYIDSVILQGYISSNKLMTLTLLKR